MFDVIERVEPEHVQLAVEVMPTVVLRVASEYGQSTAAVVVPDVLVLDELLEDELLDDEDEDDDEADDEITAPPEDPPEDPPPPQAAIRAVAPMAKTNPKTLDARVTSRPSLPLFILL